MKFNVKPSKVKKENVTLFYFYSLPLYSRFVLKGAAYNPMDVMNCLMIRRGYKMQGDPQQRTLPNIHNKDDK